ncbi:MAG TPA: 16S rRNA (guanine(527)-N(7))-methyltransferase RsmG [Roseovarius sp.]
MSLENVSRETVDRLREFEDIVLKWTPKINLVSRQDQAVVWDRHIQDSLQIFDAAPDQFRHWLDIGSGGGFPGIVVAIMAQASNPAATVTMVESDSRKAAFLRAALRKTETRARVIIDRIENVEAQSADVVSARALADLPSLLDLAYPHLAPEATCVFAKGAKWRIELATAKSKWKFNHTVVTSNLDPDAAILCIRELSRA